MLIQQQLKKLGKKPITGLTITPDKAIAALTKFVAISTPITSTRPADDALLAPTYLNAVVGTQVKDKTCITENIIVNQI